MKRKFRKQLTIRENFLLKELNSELENSIAGFRNILTIVPMPLFVKDASLCYRECNKAFLTLLDKKKSEVIGKTSAEVFDKVTAQHIELNDKKMMKDLQDQHYMEKIYTNGEVKIFDFRKSPVVINGVFNGIVGVTIDVTQREEEQNYLNKRIQEEVSKNLEQEKQHIEARMNDVKYAEIGKLSAGITHEINTPLTYIKANIEMMGYDIDDMENSTLKTNLLQDNKKIIEGVERIERIISSMREMSQQNREEQHNVNIYKTLITSLTMAHNRSKHIVPITLQDERFTLEMDSEKFTCKFLAQHQRLEQAWIIIINNALDVLSQKGDFTCNLFKINCSLEDDIITILFSDNGGGIDEKVLHTLFDPFVSTKEHGGIGIGLNIAQKIIQDHKGSIEAYNEGAGAVLKIRLPAHK